ncbi:efflux RND transporter permease subunit (plasmid) [Tabrizicola piscis]|uniref:Efflux RND transporter permease subunit n=1 Tax=Tabrizicola piscis TaxID=2494374 RepID=A0A3S8UCT6_9RHOB|nr:efflux RND transporter permease subunit [Tabrizicola piscis]AZL61437.1 efflux RND transporter permease subunit [Tabrizicola piscis]
MIRSFLFNPRILFLAVGFLTVLGLGAIQTLPRLEDPVIRSRSATILTLQPGADAARVEALVTKVIEDEVRTLPQVDSVSSTSSAGTSLISITLLDTITDTAAVWSRVRDKLADVAPLLPATAGTPILDDEGGYAYTLVAAVRWTAEGPPDRVILRRYALELEDRLRGVPGTELVALHGTGAERVQVTVDPAALAAAGLGIDAVAAALANADARSAAGDLNGTDTRIIVEIAGAFDSMDRLRSVPVAAADGGFLTLADLATIERGLQDPPPELAFIDGAPAVSVGSRMQPNQRVDLWVPRALAVIEEMQAEAPQGLAIDVVFEQAGYTSARISNVVNSLVQGLIIVVAVLFVTMGWRAAVVVGLAIPITALLTLGLFRFTGISIHQMSITGMIVALGLMVDNAIITTNAIRDGIARGQATAQAVFVALRSLWAPLAASTVTTVLAFMPIVLLPGPAGEFVGPLALSVILALVSSYAVALYFVPAVMPLIYGAQVQSQGWWNTGIAIAPLTSAFRGLIGLTLRWPLPTAAFALAFPVIGFVAMPTVPQVFFPPTDRDQFYIELRMPPATGILATEAAARELDKALRADERIRRTAWYIGESAPTQFYNVISSESANPAFAQGIIDTTSEVATETLLATLQPILDRGFPGAEILIFGYDLGPPVASPIEMRIVGPELPQLAALGQEMAAIMGSVPQVVHARALVTTNQPNLRLTIDEAAVRLAGLDLTSVAGQLDAALAGRTGGFLLEGTEQVPVTVRFPDRYRSDPDLLGTLPLTVSTREGAAIGLPLSAVATSELVPSYSGIQRLDGERVQIVRGYIDEDAIPSTVLARFQAALDAAGFALPPGYRLEVGGEAETRGDAVGALLASVALLLVLMVTTVALAFNSFRATAVVLLAGIQTLGIGFLALWFTGHAFGFLIIVGIMGLVGVAINATIMILSEFREDEAARHGDAAAMVDILTGPLSRHIWSTTITTAGGFVPLMLVPGQFWPPFAQTFVVGLLLATLIAFLFTPSAWRLVAPRARKATTPTQSHSPRENPLQPEPPMKIAAE